MIKVMSAFKRKTGMDVDAFQKYWLDVHAPFVKKLPGLRRYVQNHTLVSGYKRVEPAVDGVAELWFDNSDALRQLAGNEALRLAQNDRAEFIDEASYREVVTEDVVIKDGAIPADGVKNIELVLRKKGIQPTEFHRYWIEHHGPLGASIPQIHRYVQSHMRSVAYEGGKEPVLDGFALTWFDNTQAMRDAATTDEYANTRDDEENFVVEPLDFVITKEHVIVA